MFCPTAMSRMIVRRDTGEGYQAFLENLAKASGIETPTREDLSKIDKKRPKNNRQLRQEREILAKAAAWFARETNSVSGESTSS